MAYQERHRKNTGNHQQAIEEKDAALTLLTVNLQDRDNQI